MPDFLNDEFMFWDFLPFFLKNALLRLELVSRWTQDSSCHMFWLKEKGPYTSKLLGGVKLAIAIHKKDISERTP